MMEGHEKAVYPGGITLETGWSSDPNLVEEIRVTIGDQKGIISYKDLFGFVLMNADAEGIAKLSPATKTLVRKFVKQHNVKVKKPIPAGGYVVVNCEVDVPISVMEGLAGSLSSMKASRSPIISVG